MSKVKVDLVIIDGQHDFCNPAGSLFVPGADEDMSRLAKFVAKNSRKLDDIHSTMDSHHPIDIAHPIFWKDSNGNPPDPFTIITVDDINNGKWTTKYPECFARAKAYVEALAKGGRYPLCIWPPHCIIGSVGQTIVPELLEAFTKWEIENFSVVDVVTKGSNFWTEHYSAVQAEIPDTSDTSTLLNSIFINDLKEADIILIAGEALSHCVYNSIKDIADNFGEENIKKFVLLTDCSSSVAGFEHLGQEFIDKMSKRGMQLSTTKDFF